MSITPSPLAIEQLGAFNILQACRDGRIPANAGVGAAIAAHRMAFRDDPQIAARALRAVVCAAIRTREQAQRQVDYLTALPMEAWSGWTTINGASRREMTLAQCVWTLTRMADE